MHLNQCTFIHSFITAYRVIDRCFTATATRTSPKCVRLVRRSLRDEYASCLRAATREPSACASNSTAASGEVSPTFIGLFRSK